MADYRDLAAALSGGYGQDTGPITADTLITLKNGKTASAGDLLGLLKGFGQSIGSNLESLGRGGVASVVGAGGDLESFGRMGINKLYGAGGVNVSETPVLPTSTDILGMMPRTTAPRRETAGMEELGGYMTPATAKVLKPAATGVVRMAGQEINAGLTGQPTRSLLGTITPKPKLLDVYHGTPHTLPPTERNPLGEFDASKIGTGEGGQAYGYGIYTAEAPALAQSYANKLTKVDGQSISDQLDSRTQYLNMLKQQAADGDVNAAKNIPLIEKSISELISKGNVYKVDLPDEKIATMLDWDKPMSEQSDFVKQAIGLDKNPNASIKDMKAWEFLVATGQKLGEPFTGSPLVSEYLRKKGIAGIKYLDEGSRSAGQGTRNFVVFPGEEKSMTILERNAEKSAK